MIFIRKFGLAALVCVLGLVLVLGALPVSAYHTRPVIASNETVQLDQTQQQELAALHQEIQAKVKEVVSKYVEYGVISKEKGDKIISRLDKRYQKLEENGFIPRWDKCKK